MAGVMWMVPGGLEAVQEKLGSKGVSFEGQISR